MEQLCYDSTAVNDFLFIAFKSVSFLLFVSCGYRFGFPRMVEWSVSLNQPGPPF